MHLVPLLYGPRVAHWWAEDDTFMLKVPTQSECEYKFDFALELLHEARNVAQKFGASTTNRGAGGATTARRGTGAARTARQDQRTTTAS